MPNFVLFLFLGPRAKDRIRMSIEEIASKMSKSDLELWNELLAEVEKQALHLEAIVPNEETFRMTSPDSFRLKRVDVTVGVKRGPRLIYWYKFRDFGPGVSAGAKIPI